MISMTSECEKIILNLPSLWEFLFKTLENSILPILQHPTTNDLDGHNEVMELGPKTLTSDWLELGGAVVSDWF